MRLGLGWIGIEELGKAYMAVVPACMGKRVRHLS